MGFQSRLVLGTLFLAASAASASDLRPLIDEGKLTDLRYPDFSNHRAEISRFYEAANFEPAWIRNGSVTPRAREIIAILQAAESKGLNPEDYDAPRWSERLAANSDLTKFDLALTVCVMRYVSDLRFGRANPGLYAKENDSLTALVRRIVDTPDLRTALDPIEPQFDEYRNALKALARYRMLARNTESESLPATKKPVEPGSSYPAVPRLARLLQDLGDLPAIVVTPDDARVYKGPLVAAVKHFQSRHGQDADGRIGKGTLAALNTPLSQRVKQLEFAVERWRWVPHSFSRPPIVVNLPEFELRALNGSNQTDLEMKVVVGGALDHQTPVFSAELKHVIFHPYWNVPWSIQKDEMVPHIVKDRAYLEKNEYEVVTQAGRVVSGGMVSDDILAQLRSGNLAIRQRPGAKNALGSVKFVFPNAYNVYLHDTPSQRLFAKARRDASHGCIRVEKPRDLAEWILREETDWPKQRIAEAFSGDKTIQANLKQPIPVLIMYGTAVVAEGGEPRFYTDIYGYDADLAAQLAQGYPYRPAAKTLPGLQSGG